MRFLPARPGALYALGALLVALGLAGLLSACSAMPVLQGNLDDVAADQQAQMDAAEKGNVLRTVLSSLSAAGGAILVALGRVKSYDKAPYRGNVEGREVSATEDEVVALVEKARKAPPA